jgi:ComF family protein
MAGHLFDALLPRRCLLCGQAAGRGNLCEGCARELPRNDGACHRCALPATGLLDGVCGACLGSRPPWDRVLAPLRYAWPVDVLVQQLKFQRQAAAGTALAQAMLDAGSRPGEGRREAAAAPAARPILVPVPLHWSRELARGYNQAAELALHLGRATGWPLLDGRLRRARRTPPQTRLTASERRRNLRRAFHWRGAPLTGSTLVLVDDVMTTGSTLTACARLLRAAGAARVEAWVAARATPADRGAP